VTVTSPATVLNGSSNALVALRGETATDGGLVTITATLGTDTRTAQVRVLGPDDVPRLSSLTPMMATVVAGARQRYTVTLDLPAAGPTDVTLAFVPNTVGTVPMTVTIPADALSATFDVQVDAMAMGMAMGTLTASRGADMFSSVITVQPAPMGRLVINEIDYDMPGPGDSAEFVELYNASNGAIDLTGMTVVLINGNGGAAYTTVSLTPAGTVGPGEYVVVGSAATIAGLPATVKTVQMTGTTDLIQNGAPDAVILVDAMGATIDALSYEGSTVVNAVAVQEGTASTAALTDPGAGSICRIPNGADTDVNATDFRVCAASTKGTVNAP
jgi:hypothetical protein